MHLPNLRYKILTYLLSLIDLLPDVTVDGEGQVVVVVLVVLAVVVVLVLLLLLVVVVVLAVFLLVAEGHDFDQAERRRLLLLLRLLQRRGRFSAPRGKPGAVHDGGRRVHRRVIGRLKHRGGGREEEEEKEEKEGAEAQQGAPLPTASN